MVGHGQALTIDQAPSFITFDGRTCPAYNEAAFRYFLDIERKRAQRAMRPLLLMLIKETTDPTPDGKRVSPCFKKIFSVLPGCLREVDFVGWYREGVVAAALLSPTSPVTDSVRHHLSTRVLRALRDKLSSDEAARVALRVVVLGRPPRS